MFNEYELFLDSIGSENYWSDVGMDIARAKVLEFDNSDWIKLESVLNVKPDDWQIRCAESLSDSNDERAINILLKLAKSEDESIIIHAIESIESIFSAGCFFDSARVVLALNEGFEGSTRTVKLMVATLIKKIK
ncbi:hypothetical protein BFW87_24655 [Pseudomonas fluorescens]|uniref:HEAT repeat domain-containing protein n=1 Tax=Pseudomonas fluorescens TaxID=294 RepID=A0A1T2Y2R7_PSEFL|nr:HEAT repeat domain-containing protein [Pseudomonas fluorescens]OPA86450.1 hypothetical protein BFW87_24655 [Pseudomonas fluorescens]